MSELYFPQNASWELPSAELSVYREKAHSYALIIPVINEGARIQKQLKEIANLAPELDVIIADGGSTDGSLEVKFLLDCKVRTLLTKIDEGGLSAQLRMGYAYALEEGYEGILTVDGNGKDGMSALPDFIRALRAGADYVQGSRYAKGGRATNTPLERALGVQLIHAPLISLASRKWMRDTTNGFRGYSRKFLEDGRVQPFRSVFNKYNLLFYLAIRANRLGFNTQEIPVERNYPERDQAIPTKINNMRGKFALLGETLDAATGAFEPIECKQINSPRMSAFVIAFISLLIGLHFLNFLATPNFSPDSWYYFGLSKTIFSDFYHFLQKRSFSSALEYSASFPPLWPTLIAIVDAVFHTGARTGYYLAFIFLIGFFVIAERIVRTILEVRWVGAGLVLLAIIDERMLAYEVVAGHTIPFQMFLYGCVLYLLLKIRELKPIHGIVLGVFCGLCILNRFDSILMPFVLSLGLLFLTPRRSVSIAFICSTLVLLSPWMYYSYTTFGSLFITDNSGVALAVDADAYVSDWWTLEQASMRATALDNPTAWFLKLFKNLFLLFIRVLELGSSFMGLSILFSIVLGVAFIFLTSISREVEIKRTILIFSLWNAIRTHQGKVLCVFMMVYITQLATYVVTGYFSPRYFTGILWFISFALAALFLNWGLTPNQRQTLGAWMFVVYAVLMVVAWASNGLIWPRIDHNDFEKKWSEFDDPLIVSQLEGCLVGVPIEAPILVMGDSSLATKITALSGRHTLLEPRNMSRGRLSIEGSRAFLVAWDIEYVFVAREDRRGFVEAVFAVTPISDCTLDLYSVNQ